MSNSNEVFDCATAIQVVAGVLGGTVITNLQLGALVSPLSGLKFSMTALPFRPQSK